MRRMKYNNEKFVSWDIGGPLRDSSESMGYALKTAAKKYGMRKQERL